MHYFYGIRNTVFFYQFKVDDSYSIPTSICAFANLVLKIKILGYSFYCNYSNLLTFIKKEIKSICIYNDTA